jgi:hypothetical protein
VNYKSYVGTQTGDWWLMRKRKPSVLRSSPPLTQNIYLYLIST